MLDQEINLTNGTYNGSKGGTELQYEKLVSLLPIEFTDKIQFICSRPVPLIPGKKHVFYVHDHFTDPVLDTVGEEYYNSIDAWVFVSHTQFQWFHVKMGIPYSKSLIIENSIDPIADHDKPKDRINLIYHTTPHRGLNILYSAFDHLTNVYDNLYLDVYSSFKIYGWPERDQEYQHIFDLCKSHPKITYHGTQPNEVVKEALKKSHIFAYPSIWPETSCIAALEAMSAKNLIVCSDLGALSETVGRRGVVYRYTENVPEHLNLFTGILDKVISQNIYKDQNFLYNVKSDIDKHHSWDHNILKWKNLCKRLLDE